MLIYACAHVDPVSTSQSYEISIRKSRSKRRTNLSVFLVLMLMSTKFSLAGTCACAYAYVIVKTRLKEKKCIACKNPISALGEQPDMSSTRVCKKGERNDNGSP